MYKVHFA